VIGQKDCSRAECREKTGKEPASLEQGGSIGRQKLKNVTKRQEVLTREPSSLVLACL
jgi:hypothetical protein